METQNGKTQMCMRGPDETTVRASRVLILDFCYKEMLSNSYISTLTLLTGLLFNQSIYLKLKNVHN